MIESDKMPSIDYHVKQSISDPAIARKVNELMDMPLGIEFSPEIHHIYRKRTHNINSAFFIGLMVGMESRTPRKAILDAIRHLNDDLSLSLFKKAMQGGEED